MKNRSEDKFVWIENSSDSAAPTVVFIHGNSLGGKTFQDQLSSTELAGFRLIAIDLPGCGSGPRYPQAPDGYWIPDHVQHLVDFVHLHASNTQFVVGHSLGGHIGIAALEYLPQIKKLFIFGTPPLSVPYPVDKAFSASEEIGLLFSPDINEVDADRLASFFFHQNDEEKRKMVKELILKSDGHFRTGVGLSVAEGKVKDELQAIRNSSAQVAIALGENDRAIDQHYLRPIAEELGWNNNLFLIKNAGHLPNIEMASDFNLMLKSFFEA